MLRPRKIKEKKIESRTKVLLLQHKAIWMKHAANVERNSQKLFHSVRDETLPSVLLLYSRHLRLLHTNGSSTLAYNGYKLIYFPFPIVVNQMSNADNEKHVFEQLILASDRNEKNEKMFTHKVLQLARQRTLLRAYRKMHEERLDNLDLVNAEEMVKDVDEKVARCLENITKNIQCLRYCAMFS